MLRSHVARPVALHPLGAVSGEYTHRAVTHPYQGLDEDELTLAKGDTVFVLPYPDPNDQDDGWLYGQCNGK